MRRVEGPGVGRGCTCLACAMAPEAQACGLAVGTAPVELLDVGGAYAVIPTRIAGAVQSLFACVEDRRCIPAAHGDIDHLVVTIDGDIDPVRRVAAAQYFAKCSMVRNKPAVDGKHTIRGNETAGFGKL